MKKLFKDNIHEGDLVIFDVENPCMWSGDREGVIKFKGNNWCIETKRSGIVTIGKGYDAYYATIQPKNILNRQPNKCPVCNNNCGTCEYCSKF